jgi:AcrR family transcriptional regulator
MDPMLAYAERRRAAMDAMMKEDVYRSAVDIIMNHGARALTMDRLAKAVGVSRGTLYNYFASRDELLTHIDERAVEQIFSETEAIVAGEGTAEQKLYGLALAVFRLMETSQPLLFALFKKEIPEGPRRKAQIRLGDRFYERVQAVLQEGIDSGEFRPLPLPESAVAFFSVMDGELAYLRDREIARPVEKTVSTLMSVILPAFRAG